jgi:flagellar hook-associated protein 3 FlgL
MDLSISPSTQQYLLALQQTQNQLQQAQAQLSSGYRLQQASDDPAAISQIYENKTQIAFNQQTQSNLQTAGNELSSADSALQSAVQAVQRAISLAAQGSTTTSSATTRANLAIEVQGLQQTLVDISQTQVNGKYIFSGDQSSQPSYALDPTQPDGVQQLLTTTNTRVIQDINGTPIATSRTATQIFDAQDSSGNPVSGNVFAAINSLITSLQNNDQTGITTAASSLNAASTYLNGQVVFYGEAEDRVSAATQLAQQYLTQQQTALGQVQDANVPTAALELTQAQTQQQAALSVEAKIQQEPNLFSLLA